MRRAIRGAARLDHSRQEPWGSRHGQVFAAFQLQHSAALEPVASRPLLAGTLLYLCAESHRLETTSDNTYQAPRPCHCLACSCLELEAARSRDGTGAPSRGCQPPPTGHAQHTGEAIPRLRQHFLWRTPSHTLPLGRDPMEPNREYPGSEAAASPRGRYLPAIRLRCPIPPAALRS